MTTTDLAPQMEPVTPSSSGRRGPPASTRVVAGAIQTLLLDAALLEAAAALQRAGVDFLVLKGAVIAARLYDPDELREYTDLDILVAHRDRERARSIFEILGYCPLREGVRSDDLRRSRDATYVDLHWTISGAEAPAESVFASLWRHRCSVEVQDTPLPCLDDAALAMHLALHAFSSEPEQDKPLTDLERGLDRLPDRAWIEARHLAGELQAEGAFGVGLRRTPRGRALADQLGLPVGDRAGVATSATTALVWNELTSSSGRRLRVVRNVLLPPPIELRAGSRLANRGVIGLLLAYLVHVPLLVVRRRHELGRFARQALPRRGGRGAHG